MVNEVAENEVAESGVDYGMPNSGIVYDEVQQAVINQAMESKIMVLTGGPVPARPLRPKVS